MEDRARKETGFDVVNEPLEVLAVATVSKIEHEWPAAIAIGGAQEVFLLLSRLAVNSYQTIKYLSAGAPLDSPRCEERLVEV